MEQQSESATVQDKKIPEKKIRRTKDAAFFVGITTMATIFGFGTTVIMAKRKDPKFFSRGFMPNKKLPESGGSLALRALGIGSFYAVTGFGLITFGIWKLVGAKNMEEFTAKVQQVMPETSKKETPGRNEFSSIQDLVDYLLDEDAKKKNK